MRSQSSRQRAGFGQPPGALDPNGQWKIDTARAIPAAARTASCENVTRNDEPPARSAVVEAMPNRPLPGPAASWVRCGLSMSLLANHEGSLMGPVWPDVVRAEARVNVTDPKLASGKT